MTVPAYVEVSVVAGGWSFSRIDRSRVPGYLIGVNDAGLRLSGVDCVVSMDRLWTEHRWQQLVVLQREAWLRHAAVKNLDWRSYASSRGWLRVFSCDHESSIMVDGVPVPVISDYPGSIHLAASGEPLTLNGTNSGMCAVNRAYQLKPKVLWLFGFDCQEGPKGEKHWYVDYDLIGKDGRPTSGGTSPKKLSEWARQYDGIAATCRGAGIEVINVSDRTLITSFKTMGSAEFNKRG